MPRKTRKLPCPSYRAAYRATGRRSSEQQGQCPCAVATVAHRGKCVGVRWELASVRRPPCEGGCVIAVLQTVPAECVDSDGVIHCHPDQLEQLEVKADDVPGILQLLHVLIGGDRHAHVDGVMVMRAHLVDVCPKCLRPIDWGAVGLTLWQAAGAPIDLNITRCDICGIAVDRESANQIVRVVDYFRCDACYADPMRFAEDRLSGAEYIR